MVPTLRVVTLAKPQPIIALLLASFILATTLPVGGCAYARLESALVERQPVTSGELTGVTIVRTSERGDIQDVPGCVGIGLKPGDHIETDGRTHLVITFPSKNARVTLYPNTKLTISSVLLEFGAVLIEIFVESRDKLVLESSYAEMKSFGTAYKVEARSTRHLSLTVLQGTVEAVIKGSREAMRVGEYERLTLGAGASRVVVQLEESDRNSLLREFNDLGERTGNRRAIVPECIGLSVDEANGRLADAGLRGESRMQLTERDDEVGRVLSQKPKAGEFARRGARVALAVGERAVPVPSVVGTPAESARAVLQRSDLNMRVRVEKITGKSRFGEVIHQEPRAETLVPRGSVVEVDLEAESVPVPKLVGRPLQDAQRAESRLRIVERGRKHTGKQRVGTILTQDEPPAKLVAPGTEIGVVVEAPRRAPNVDRHGPDRPEREPGDID